MKFGSHIRAVTIMTFVLCILLLVGCSKKPEPGPITETTLVVAINGSITYYLVEDFDKDYYDVLELNRMAAEEAAAYNEALGRSAQEDPLVEVLSVEMVRDGSQKVVLQYALRDAEAFTDFFGFQLFYGTIAQAGARDLLIPEGIYDTGDTSHILHQTELSALSNWHVIITNGKGKVIPPKSPKYLNTGARLQEDGSVALDAEEGEMFIIFK
jgi:hypothetical protein